MDLREFYEMLEAVQTTYTLSSRSIPTYKMKYNKIFWE